MTTAIVVRRIKARPSIVFDALVTPEGIRAWWGPDDGPVLIADVDPRVGGRFKVRFRMLDGSEQESSGTYLEVDPPKRLAMTWRWISTPERESHLAIDLKPIPEGTEVTLTHSRLKDDENARGHERGWGGALDKLVRKFEGAAS